MARGKHLFPFRTEKLSLSAPMVLGSQGPGRVGRRRFNCTRAALGRLVVVNRRALASRAEYGALCAPEPAIDVRGECDTSARCTKRPWKRRGPPWGGPSLDASYLFSMAPVLPEGRARITAVMRCDAGSAASPARAEWPGTAAASGRDAPEGPPGRGGARAKARAEAGGGGGPPGRRGGPAGGGPSGGGGKGG